ncbi:MAG TPA: copper resistance protein B [Rhodanobacteraceae bacterium]|nr:copper resistance protein B [Rhodanobacteraceae bacterium]
MKTLTCKALPCLTLGMAFAVSPVFAQDAMQDMDMSHMHHQTTKPAKPDSQKKPQQGKQKQKPTAHAMHGMHMPSKPNMPPKPAWNLTGELERLDIGSQIGIRPVVRGLDLKPMQMDMPGMQMQGGDMPPNARSADYSDGVGHSTMPGMHMLDDAALGMLLIDRLEYVDGRDDNGVALDAQGWYGTDANKVWFKAEGEHGGGRLQDLRFEALWSHPVGIYWNMQLGVRHDFGVGPGRIWAAFGVQGLAQYWFDVEATVYVGQAGRTAFRFESEYEMLITQRLILQPDFEVNVYGRDDPQLGLGSGLSDTQLGLRLRYEFTRKFAPYIGVEWERKFGNTADFARQAGEPVFDPRLVAGLRFWF